MVEHEKNSFEDDPFLLDPYNLKLADYALDCLTLSSEEPTTQELKNRLWGSGIVDLALPKSVADAGVHIAVLKARSLFDEFGDVMRHEKNTLSQEIREFP